MALGCDSLPRFLKLRYSRVAKRRQQIALGGSPRKQANVDGLSREAAAEAEVDALPSTAASRLKALPCAANLGLTPKAIR